MVGTRVGARTPPPSLKIIILYDVRGGGGFLFMGAFISMYGVLFLIVEGGGNCKKISIIFFLKGGGVMFFLEGERVLSEFFGGRGIDDIIFFDEGGRG